MEFFNPPGWPRPKGYSNGIVAPKGRMLFVAGEVGWNPVSETVETDDFALQVKQALENIVAIVTEAGGKPEHICRMTWFITTMDEYVASFKEIGEHYRAIIGKHFPVMAAIGIKELMEEGAKVEIEATAVIPD